MSTDLTSFLNHYAKSVKNGDAALFIGAGMSRAAGFVDWKGLLAGIAADLQLKLDRETDLVAIAQYHVNKERNRSRINEAILERFNNDAIVTRNHEIIARLPIETIWTTNYDTLIEKAIRDAGRKPDVKQNHQHLAQTLSRRDVVVYKMHGDVSQPQEAVITKDDYERYGNTHRLFIETLKGDLISKTFLFLGFSFTDPNIDYILGRVRVLLGENQRTHYCIMKKPDKPTNKTKSANDDYEYEIRRQNLRVSDLARFGVQTILVDDYNEITRVLESISRKAHERNIFVSGSARDFGDFGQERLYALSRRLGSEIISRDYNLVSGFGRGLAEHVILGALNGLYSVKRGRESNRTILRPFPRTQTSDYAEQSRLNKLHREDLISQSGAVVFLCGNRGRDDGQAILSPGVLEEYEITQRLGRVAIPVGCTGYAAHAIWDLERSKTVNASPVKGIKKHLTTLGNLNKSDDEIINAIFAIADAAVGRNE